MSRTKKRSARLVDEGAFDLDTELSESAKREIEKIKIDEKNYPIDNDKWVQFFYEYFKYIENEKNMEICLSKIPELHNVSIADLYKVGIEGGGFDNAFDIHSDTEYNIKLYYSLFTQFKDGTNKIIGCDKLNLLLSYVGKAVLQIADEYREKSPFDLIAFLKKIVVILELSVFKQVFLHYMTGDSTGHTDSIEYRHNTITHGWYFGIWIRKQEFLGIITNNGKNPRLKYDNGLRLFVRNFLNRVITYMRTKKSDYYPLKHEKPYNYSGDIKKVLRYPLPDDGVYQYTTPIHYYYISRDDWNNIPNFLLPEEAKLISFDKNKNFVHPSKWKNPPPDWWIKRIKDKNGLLNGFAWWESGINEEKYKKELEGTDNLKKWLAINGTLPQQYKSHAVLWDDDNKDYVEPVKKKVKNKSVGGVGISENPSKKSNKFKIIPDTDITLDPEINNKLKYALKSYYVYNKDICAKYELIDDVYSNKLNGSLLLSLTTEKINNLSKKKAAKAARAATI
jgi:hypothetical protein